MGRRVNVFGGATIPQPLVQELPQDAAWDEWSKAVEDHEAKYAPTAPASLPMTLREDARYDATEPATLEELDAREAARAAQATEPAPLVRTPGLSLDEVVHDALRDGRVCLKPSQWTKLYVLLAQYRSGTARLPPPPLTGRAWEATPPLAKRMSFHTHLEWASMHGCLAPVAEFIRSQPDDAWHKG